ncbi:hypothetical protein ACFQT0_30470 [Hymenobacter humi]|uniref:Uncharacterized protein n=1 Tax=Hymenobacter humi TaxID=1411620 RepID=A0ABW2UDY0_9BACT
MLSSYHLTRGHMPPSRWLLGATLLPATTPRCRLPTAAVFARLD